MVVRVGRDEAHERLERLDARRERERGHRIAPSVGSLRDVFEDLLERRAVGALGVREDESRCSRGVIGHAAPKERAHVAERAATSMKDASLEREECVVFSASRGNERGDSLERASPLRELGRPFGANWRRRRLEETARRLFRRARVVVMKEIDLRGERLVAHRSQALDQLVYARAHQPP